jgi:hypothetical protein
MKKLLTVFLLFVSGWCVGQDQRIWATYYGDDGYDDGNNLTSDIYGNVYLAGRTSSTSNMASGGFQNTYGGQTDAFLVKFDSTGNRLWATYYGGTDYDFGYSVATDAFGNVYLAGSTYSTSGIASGGFQDTLSNASGNAFLVKFDSFGNRLWATYYGGNMSENGLRVVTDNWGNVYLSGNTFSTSGIASGGFQNTLNGIKDTYLVKFDSLGNRLWATYYGGDNDDYGWGIATDIFGNVYLSGQTQSNSGVASGGFQNSISTGEADAFLVKFDSSGARLWATYYGGAGDEGINGLEANVATDVSGNVYLGGRTNSSSGIASGGFQNNYAGGTADAFLVKFDTDGNRLWGTYYGGTGVEECFGVATDDVGNVYLAGDTYSANGLTPDGFQNNLGGEENAFLVKFNSNGNLICATYYGQNHEEDGRVALDNFGAVYLSGTTNSTSNLASGGFQNTYGGGNHDAYLVRFISCSNDLSLNSTSINPPCIGECSGNATAIATQGFQPYSYLWSNSQTTQTATELCAGTYIVTVTDAIDSSITVSVIITDGLDIPLTITQNGDTLYATTAPNYQWYLNDTIITGATSQNYFITQSGNYSVITTTDSCTFISNIIETGCLCVGISEIDFSKKITLYPNPATTTLTLTTEQTIKNAELKIMDAIGQEVYHSIFDIERSSFDISQFPTGLYYLTLQSAEGTATKKFEVIR